jgi:hypothetical protein
LNVSTIGVVGATPAALCAGDTDVTWKGGGDGAAAAVLNDDEKSGMTFPERSVNPEMRI